MPKTIDSALVKGILRNIGNGDNTYTIELTSPVANDVVRNLDNILSNIYNHSLFYIDSHVRYFILGNIRIVDISMNKHLHLNKILEYMKDYKYIVLRVLVQMTDSTIIGLNEILHTNITDLSNIQLPVYEASSNSTLIVFHNVIIYNNRMFTFNSLFYESTELIIVLYKMLLYYKVIYNLNICLVDPEGNRIRLTENYDIVLNIRYNCSLRTKVSMNICHDTKETIAHSVVVPEELYILEKIHSTKS